MRVISGSARGKGLLAPEGLAVRPTADRIKESLFNIIAFDLQDIVFLDLFGGSGAIGIEALSRGASRAVFVDNSKESIRYITHNLQNTGFTNKAQVVCADAMEAIEGRLKNFGKFDMVFIDPPYSKIDLGKCLDGLIRFNILNDGGTVIIEQGSDEPYAESQWFHIIKEKNYKTTRLVFMTNLSDVLER